ncbi:MAG: dihydrofolate reductase family protein [Candidatus Aenigmarchaeota archaeon]|nr:dihydrofolate reductase family protein [Candidatus Aenigmarchaeota archaeon]MDI6722028.1 dihydrofolate reductase family protein [Candidatus Aenigmarchaeota archaeon]
MKFSGYEGTVEEFANFYRIDEKMIPRNRPYSWYMAVVSADGFMSFREKGGDPLIFAGGKGIAGGHRADEKGMEGAITDYRALEFGWVYADAILGSAEIIRQEPEQEWNATSPDFLQYRKNVLKKYNLPIRVVVTGRGDINMKEPIFNSDAYKTLILTSEKGKEAIEQQVAGLDVDPLKNTKLYVYGEKIVEDFTDAFKMLRHDWNVRILDIQGGPRLAGQILFSKLIDELHLTRSPLIIGSLNSEGKPRPTLFEGVSFDPYNSPLREKINETRSGGHEIARYNIIYKH